MLMLCFTMPTSSLESLLISSKEVFMLFLFCFRLSGLVYSFWAEAFLITLLQPESCSVTLSRRLVDGLRVTTYYLRKSTSSVLICTALLLLLLRLCGSLLAYLSSKYFLGISSCIFLALMANFRPERLLF